MNISELLDGATDGVHPDVSSLVAGGRARGRRRVVRRRIAGGTSVAAVTAGIGALVLVSLPGGAPQHAGGISHGAGAQQSSTGAVPASDEPSGPVSSSASARAEVAITPQAVLQTALDLLPGHGATGQYSGRSSDGFVAAEFVWNDGTGAAEVDVSLDYGPTAETATQFCHDVGCTPDANGAVLWTKAGNVRAGDTSSTKEWFADYFRADGVHVSISEYNSDQQKDAASTRPEPPFTLAQLETVLQSDRWTTQIPSAFADQTAGLFTPDPTN